MLYLASQSPRRAHILKKYHYKFNIISHHFNESSLHIEDFSTPRHFVKELAKQKALSVKKYASNWVLAADTIVVKDNKIYGKPNDYDQAFKFLTCLQNTYHHVISAFCLYHHHHHRIDLKNCLNPQLIIHQQ